MRYRHEVKPFSTAIWASKLIEEKWNRPPPTPAWRP
jgi:hypothetical protein